MAEFSLKLIPETEVLEAWPMLPARMLRRARRQNEIRFFAFPNGAYYEPRDVEQYLTEKFSSCPAPESQETERPQNQGTLPRPAGGRSETITSTNPTLIAGAPGTLADMTPDLAASIESAFGQRTPKKQRSPSASSRPQRPSTRSTPRTPRT